MFFDETVQIKDSSGTSFNISISIPTIARLAYGLAREGDFHTWRPKFWGGEWEVLDSGRIKPSSGKVWYKRAATDYANGLTNPSSVTHLDIFLWSPDDGDSEEDWGIALRSFKAFNSYDSGGGDGYLHPAWALKSPAGALDWEVPSRAISR